MRLPLVLGVLCGCLFAQTVEEAAGSVAKSFQAGETEAVQRLASQYWPDPWLVALHLCASGNQEAAAKFNTFLAIWENADTELEEIVDARSRLEALDQSM